MKQKSRPILTDIKKSLAASWLELKNFWAATKKPIAIIVIILAITFFAIFRANFSYIDDMGRSTYGYKGWSNFSRWTSNILAIFVHADIRLSDISPLPQIIAIILLALSCGILLYVFKIKIYHQKITFWSIAAVIILAISPYFLECFSYKFDSPYMALSIFASLVPFIFLGAPNFVYYSAIFIGTLIMCTTYQAASSIFLMTAISIALARFINGEKLSPLIKFLLKSSAAFLLGLIVFRFFLMRPTPEGDYVNNSLLSLAELIPGTIGHLLSYFQLVFSDFRTLWLILIALIILIFPALAIIKVKARRLAAAPIIIVGTLLTLCLSFGLYPALALPLMVPRAMYGFGIFLALISLQISCLGQHSLPKIFPTALAYCFIVFTFLYGNALSQQKDWLEFRTASVMDDLKNLPILQENIELSLRVTGDIGYATPIQNYLRASSGNILERLIPTTFNRNHYWGAFYPVHFFGLNAYISPEQSPAITPDLTTYQKEVDNYYHSIYTKGNEILIDLK